MRNKEFVLKTLINKMFKIAGHNVTYDDIVNRKDDWYNEYTMTQEQNEKWMNWGKKFLVYKGDMDEFSANKQMQMINLSYGLKTKE